MENSIVTPKNPIEAKAEQLLAMLMGEVERRGYGTHETCASNSFGWSMEVHLAMEWLQRHTPEGYKLTRSVKFEVTDWVFVKL
jgi:hypothetical protein